MFCNACGQPLDPAARLCSRCGAATPISYTPTPAIPQNTIAPRTSDEEGLRRARIIVALACIMVGAVALATLQMSAASIAILALIVFGVGWSAKSVNLRYKIGFVVVSLIIVFTVDAVETRRQAALAAKPGPISGAPRVENSSPVITASQSRSNIPPPKFRIFRAKLDEGISVVVSPATTDEQLKSLLWFFREKVRSHQFKEIGITRPTSKQWGKLGYLSGMISIYRGEKCANEGFSDVEGTGPCGSGDHAAAYYHWGLLVNGTFDSDADEASVFSANNSTKLFDYEDHWQLPSDLQSKLDAEKQTEEDDAKLQQQGEEIFAKELEDRLKGRGFDITVSVGAERDELVLDSDMFKDTPTRVQFLNSVLPDWRHDLCHAGFNQVRLRTGGLFSIGDAYLIGCH